MGLEERKDGWGGCKQKNGPQRDEGSVTMPPRSPSAFLPWRALFFFFVFFWPFCEMAIWGWACDADPRPFVLEKKDLPTTKPRRVRSKSSGVEMVPIPHADNTREATTTERDAATIDVASRHANRGKSRGKGPTRRRHLLIPPHRDLPLFWPDGQTQAPHIASPADSVAPPWTEPG